MLDLPISHDPTICIEEGGLILVEYMPKVRFASFSCQNTIQNQFGLLTGFE